MEEKSKKGTLGEIPLMTDEEIECIKSYLDKNHTMLEWGSGGSTLYFPKYVKNYISIESEEDWYNKIKDEVDDNVTIYLVPMNDDVTVLLDSREIKTIFDDKRNITLKIEDLEFSMYKNYTEKIRYLDIPKFDIILIDGRARLACALNALAYMDDESIMFIHDYYMHPDFQYIEKYMNIIEHVGKYEYYARVGLNIHNEDYSRRNTLAVLKKKNDIQWKDIL